MRTINSLDNINIERVNQVDHFDHETLFTAIYVVVSNFFKSKPPTDSTTGQVGCAASATHPLAKPWVPLQTRNARPRTLLLRNFLNSNIFVSPIA